MDSIDTLIIGAGALGLACAARLAEPGRSTLIVEQETLVGSHTSSRNSEVIHAGIYYPPGSLKAELCLEGRERLYAWCERWQVPHRRLGKLLVAVSDEERGKLDVLANNAKANGVDELQPIGSAQLSALEPSVRGVAALLSPNTGIIDSHTFLQSLQACAEGQGAELVLQTCVDNLTHDGDGWIASGTSAGEPFSLKAQRVINAAGLFAQRLAQRTNGLTSQRIPQLHLCQGNYFNYNGKSPFSHLVYPMPEANTSGLGVHATLDMGGQLRFGPDTRYLDAINYCVGESLRETFASAIRRYFPALDSARLVPGYAGIRPKLSGPGEAAEDFMLQMPADHGLPGLVNLFGIESPGLTASLAIAERIAHRL